MTWRFGDILIDTALDSTLIVMYVASGDQERTFLGAVILDGSVSGNWGDDVMSFNTTSWELSE